MNVMPVARRTAVLTLMLPWVLGLDGCASPGTPKLQADFWSGRLSLQVQSDPPQTWHAGFELQGSALEGELVLLSPLGQALVRLNWSPTGALFEQGSKQFREPTLQALGDRLGTAIPPIAAMFEWLAGRATAVAGWQVDLSRHGQGRLLAERLSPAPAARLAIVLDR
jgi:outer membrane lipoprotein LolB